jgi:hypothetical protein
MHSKKNTLRVGPESSQDNPEHPVMGGQARMRVPRRQNRELLTQCKVLKYEVAARSNTATQG